MHDLGLISKIRSTITGQHYLYFIHDRTGRIIELLNPENSRYPIIAREMEETGTLAAYYDMSGLADSEERQYFTQERRFVQNVHSFSFYTSLPQSSLYTQRISAGRYLARMSFMDVSPNLGAHTVFSHLLADTDNDRLLGFAGEFHAFFRTAYPDPSAMINLPLSAVLTPTPGEFLKSVLPGFSLDRLKGYGAFYEKDFAQEDFTNAEETPLGGAFSRSGKGLLWENRDKLYSFITFLKTVNTETHDFAASITFENILGQGPQFMAGGRYQGEDHLPDDSGYLAGRGVWEEPRTILKKHGFPVIRHPDPGIPQGETTLVFCKVGAAFFLYQDQERLFGHYDSDFLENPSLVLTLELRQGAACRLKRFSLRVRERERVERPRRYMAGLVNRPDRHFMMDRYFNYDLNSRHFQHVAGYLMNDISEMQDRITTLDRQYRDQLRNGEKLKSLLMHYRQEEEFIGAGSAMTLIRETARTVAHSVATVLIEGETGSGKEVLARHIHNISNRREGPFIKVDCSTVPQGLIESHLFGHEKGAFTGAISRNTGMLEKAHKGTLFLDEVGNLNPETQAKLLQFLNDFTLTRIGGSAPVLVDVRCIVASNVNLEEKVRAGTFREDLYYRMNVVSLKIPPLRERMEDIPALCNRFLPQFNAEAGKKIEGFTPQALQKLDGYSWPGNIRELKNTIQRAVIFCDQDFISAEMVHLPRGARGAGDPGRRKRSPFYLSETSAGDVKAALEKHHGHATRAAAELGISRAAFYVFIKRAGIKTRDFRKGFKAG